MVVLFVASNLVEAGLELNQEPPPVKLIGEVEAGSMVLPGTVLS